MPTVPFTLLLVIQVIRQLGSQTLQFRILALSATPGGDTWDENLTLAARKNKTDVRQRN